MNNTILLNATQVSPLNVQLLSFGWSAIVSNLLIIFTLFRNILYLKKSSFIAGLAVGDLLEGIAITLSGCLRIVQESSGNPSPTVQPFSCMKILVTPLALVGTQIPGLMLFLMGAERFVAVIFYNWYYNKWRNKTAWKLTACIYLFCIISLAVAVAIAFSYDDNARIPYTCAPFTVVGVIYNSYNNGCAFIGGLSLTVGSFVAMIILTKKKRRLNVSNGSSNVSNHLKKQWQSTRVALCLSVIDLGLVVIPYVLSLVGNYVPSLAIVILWSYQLLCLRSSLNLIAYLLVNSDFRQAMLKAFCLKKNVSTVTVRKLSVKSGNTVRDSQF